jgi:hypothetical protein
VGAGAGADGSDGAGAGAEGELGAGAGLGSFFSLGAGSEPDGENDAISGGSATLTAVTADGAAALEPSPPVALPAAKAAPNASTAATAAIAMSLP